MIKVRRYICTNIHTYLHMYVQVKRRARVLLLLNFIRRKMKLARKNRKTLVQTLFRLIEICDYALFLYLRTYRENADRSLFFGDVKKCIFQESNIAQSFA